MKTSFLSAHLAFTVMLLGGLVLPASGAGLTLLVYQNGDAGAGSLRQAVQDNQALGGGNTIVFSNSVTGTITLTSGEILISRDLTITGPGPYLLGVSGNNASRIFRVTNAVVSISGLGVVNGYVFGQPGGGIRNYGTLTLSNCIVRDCRATTFGGGVESPGPLTVLGSSIISNNASGGGGISGSGINAGSTLQLTNCTVTGNQGPDAVCATNAGVWSTTIAANIARGFSGSATVGNSIIASGGIPDVYGTFTSAGYNLIGAGENSTGFGAVGDQVGTSANRINPNLRPVGSYGGQTLTMPPLPGSPAIDQGKNFGGNFDQRGRARSYDYPAIPNAVLGDGTDIGAVENGLQTTVVVTTTNDAGAGSLRNALQLASAFENDTITFAPEVTNMIVLTSGQLFIDKSLSVVGPGAQVLQISANTNSRVFQVNAGTVRISGLTITRGRVGDEGGGLRVEGGDVTLSGCNISSNLTVVGWAGGIAIKNNARVTIENSAVIGNEAPLAGGGIFQMGSSVVSIRNSTISGNRVTEPPGTLFPPGAGVLATGGQLSLLSCTIIRNVSTSIGGGVHNNGSAVIDVRNSIIADNTAPNGPDVGGAFTSGGYNLISRTNFSTGFINGINADQAGSSAAPLDARVGALGFYGGATPAHPLRFDSPALDKGKSFGLATDQRGMERTIDDPGAANSPGGDGTDIGAFEADPRLRIVDFRRSNNDIVLSLSTMPGRNYRAEFTNELGAGAWTPATSDAVGTGYLLWLTNYGGANQPKRFYRGAVVP